MVLATPNSNGLVPLSPITIPTHPPSFLCKAFGAILPTHYTCLPTTGGISHSQTISGGTQNDGVFANVTARSSRPVQVCTDDGTIYVMSEETQSNAPPVRRVTSTSSSLIPAFKSYATAPTIMVLHMDDANTRVGSVSPLLPNLEARLVRKDAGEVRV